MGARALRGPSQGLLFINHAGQRSCSPFSSSLSCGPFPSASSRHSSPGSIRRGLIGQPQKLIYDPVLSPDGRTVLVTATDKDDRDIWVHDVNRPVKNPLTFDARYDSGPVWSPSGNRVAFQSLDKERQGIVVKAADLPRMMRIDAIAAALADY